MSHRLFLALPISPELQATIARWREAYVRLPVRWVEGKNLHVTLVPPWEEDDIEKAKERLLSLQNNLAHHPLPPPQRGGDLILNFNRVRFGPRPDKTPRLIWAVGDIPRSLMFLIEKVMEVFEQPFLNRSFRLHLTLARFQAKDFRYFAKEEFGEVRWSEKVEKVVLMESHLLPTGAEYEVLDQVRLVMTETAVFAGGCFWCTEAVFKNLKGVLSVVPGYTGGSMPNPTYEQVCSGKTGHAEAIKIEFNPNEIKFTDLLNVFFATHDPTTLNQQGDDVGTQYRSAIFYTSDEQRQEAERLVRELEAAKTFKDPILTELEPLDKFYEAEDYHKNYYAKNPEKPYCQVVIDPKVAKLRAKFGHLLKKRPE